MNILKQFHYVKDDQLRKELIENYDEEFANKNMGYILYDYLLDNNKLAYCIRLGFKWSDAAKGSGDYWVAIWRKAKTNQIELFDKVKCLVDNLCDLRRGKKYPLLDERGDSYLIIDENFCSCCYAKEYFKKLNKNGNQQGV